MHQDLYWNADLVIGSSAEERRQTVTGSNLKDIGYKSANRFRKDHLRRLELIRWTVRCSLALFQHWLQTVPQSYWITSRSYPDLSFIPTYSIYSHTCLCSTTALSSLQGCRRKLVVWGWVQCRGSEVEDMSPTVYLPLLRPVDIMRPTIHLHFLFSVGVPTSILFWHQIRKYCADYDTLGLLYVDSTFLRTTDLGFFAIVAQAVPSWYSFSNEPKVLHFL